MRTYKVGRLRGEKITYKDGTGCCIWIPLKEVEEGEEEGGGICFDFSADQIPDLKKLAEVLEQADPDIFVPDPEEEKHRAEWERKEKTWQYKVKDFLDDFTIAFSPFDWRFSRLFVSRPVEHKKQLHYQLCNGFMFGPFTVTWPR